MIQLIQYSFVNVIQQGYVSIYDEMTSMAYKPLLSFESQLTGNTKLALPYSLYLTNQVRSVGIGLKIVSPGGTENLSAGDILFGTDDFPFGFYNLTIYQNNNDTNLVVANTIKVVYNGLVNLKFATITGGSTEDYKSYTTNDTDTESVYITI